MPLENLTIARASLHEVHKRADDRTIVAPTYAAHLLDLDERGRAVFERRVLQAFQSDAKCMAMTIQAHGDDSVASIGAEIAGGDDAAFVIKSRRLADLLAQAQTSRAYPGGLVVTFDGTLGYPARPFFGVMKAEMHEAFLKGADLQARFVDSVFLSPKTKLYKIGLFTATATPPTALPDGWSATVYDSQLTAAERDGAALYFHETFLGLSFPENSAHLTKSFFQKTRDFIKSAPISEEDKVDLRNGLYSYLKLDRSPTLQVSAFARQFMTDDLGDDYQRHMRRERFTDGAVQKDLSEISGQLKTRKLRFGGSLTLSGPAQAIKDNVEILPIEGPDGQHWTQLTLHTRLQGEA